MWPLFFFKSSDTLSFLQNCTRSRALAPAMRFCCFNITSLLTEAILGSIWQVDWWSCFRKKNQSNALTARNIVLSNELNAINKSMNIIQINVQQVCSYTRTRYHRRRSTIHSSNLKVNNECFTTNLCFKRWSSKHLFLFDIFGVLCVSSFIAHLRVSLPFKY